MASLFDRVARLARNPKNQQMIDRISGQAQRMANDPKTRAKIEQKVQRVQSEIAKRRGGGGSTGRRT
ncbi:MAG: hypothetical protein ACRC35_08760 [Angustibacter sp.]